MNSEDKTSIEILSKLVIQLKTSQNETVKLFKQEILDLKTEFQKSLIDLKSEYHTELLLSKEEINHQKNQLIEKEQLLQNEINQIKSKFEKEIVELREDMLKLLNKYESKFINQDDEIDILKKKCEISACKVCNYESFKVHFFQCPECESTVCTNCLQICKNCKTASCIECLKRCNNCSDLECTKCLIVCDKCSIYSCKDCYDRCYVCSKNECKKCLIKCRKCEKIFCNTCAKSCEKCKNTISCKSCFDKDNLNEKCPCGKEYCFICEDDCQECSIPCLWENSTRIFQGYHIKSASTLPPRCLVKCLILSKGINTTHLGITTDAEFKFTDMPTENFWSLCLNTGEKFSKSEYKKSGATFTKYADSLKEGDYVYIRIYDGEVRFLINRRMYPSAFFVDKKEKLFLYCLTHDDSTQIEIKSLKIYK